QWNPAGQIRQNVDGCPGVLECLRPAAAAAAAPVFDVPSCPTALRQIGGQGPAQADVVSVSPEPPVEDHRDASDVRAGGRLPVRQGPLAELLTVAAVPH